MVQRREILSPLPYASWDYGLLRSDPWCPNDTVLSVPRLSRAWEGQAASNIVPGRAFGSEQTIHYSVVSKTMPIRNQNRLGYKPGNTLVTARRPKFKRQQFVVKNIKWLETKTYISAATGLDPRTAHSALQFLACVHAQKMKGCFDR